MSNRNPVAFWAGNRYYWLGVFAYWLDQPALAGARPEAMFLHCSTSLPNKPVLVYFTTPTAHHAKPSSALRSSEYRHLLGENVQVIEIDATERPDLAKTWGVMSVPTTFLLDARGEARYVNNGVARAEKLMEQIQTL